MSSAAPRVKNKGVAPIQVTAEQLLRESFERADPGVQAPKHRISDAEELKEYQGRMRKQFEDRSRINRLAMGNWIRYAQWELEQKEYARARSIFERGIDVDSSNVPIWLKYIESEMRNRNINHARNLCDRAVTVMPRVDKFWYKYVYMEETLGNIAGTRQIFERWMQWEPDEQAWVAYVNLEKRYGETEKARAVFERFTVVHPEPLTWLKWSRFEQDFGDADNVREVFTLAIDTLGDEFMDEKIFVAYARFETSLKEYERARVIFKYALDRMARSQSRNLYREYTTFEKRFGDKDGIEDVVMAKRRIKYEEEIKADPNNYDTWLDYLRMEEEGHEVGRIRDVYERAIAQVPPSREKREWRRYIYIWLNYSVFEELETQDFERTRAVFKAALSVVPHEIFTFAKLWSLYANYELRQGNVGAARKVFGHSIGRCPKDKLFKDYIQMELSLKEFDRCRQLYQKYLEYNASSCYAWMQFARLETELGDDERARAIYEMGIDQTDLDMPELLWKSYIDFEFEGEDYDRTRMLYERLLEKTSHVKVWISFAQFELSVPEPEEDETTSLQIAQDRCRAVFVRAHAEMKKADLKEERVLLLESWAAFEADHGSDATQKKVQGLMPKQVKKRRQLDDGTMEEYFDYLFPSEDDQRSKNLLNLLAAARAWKEKEAQKEMESRTETV
ncbi:putative Cell cycle control protein [Taphrina deformans PYCC 5710]|uniref:Cell cycle control protein n=1 Tax=Taphrina deformans (strain PYCC 5710 / ATCC 11124 / CBS 356.35 / IMI 108563 / JCM 9778 / NBRC 8474) TaxID=1097556 RepID=R4XBE6_TAPDE|nr:putative Cell cycle control protein [Taphrina deformans PYCC 5710]|eukprot:CCG80658.1 putative Cell cycle control protein [Taphrina deformans PYCC 5710]